MTNIYEQHDKAFNQVSAYVLMRNGDQKGTIAIKYPKDGAGRLYVYIHIHGLEMVRGMASGYGYDKRSAAIRDAIRKIVPKTEYFTLEQREHDALLRAADNMDSGQWERDLGEAGYNVLRAI